MHNSWQRAWRFSIEGPPETPQTIILHYHIEGFKEGPQLVPPIIAEKCQCIRSLWLFESGQTKNKLLSYNWVIFEYVKVAAILMIM